MAGTDPRESTPPTGRGYETRDISVRWIVILTAAFVVSMPVVLFAMHALFDYFAAREARNQPPSLSLIPRDPNPLPPSPRLQDDPMTDLKTHQKEENAKSERYAWLDRSAGRVRIPVERAMELVVERGLPPRTGPKDPGVRSATSDGTEAGPDRKATR